MNFSIWDYIRQRTRNAVLSGIQDAMDFVEQGDTNGDQHAKAEQLASKLNPPKGLPGVSPANDASPPEAAQEPAGATANGAADRKADPPQAEPQAAQAAKPNPAPTQSPPQRPKAESFDTELEQRFQDAAVPPPQSTPPRSEDGRVLKDADGKPLRKRGRPRKDSGL